MNTLGINVTIPSLSALTPISTNTYRFVIKFFNSSGGALGNSNIPNVYTDDVTTTSTSFQLQVPVTSGDYTIPNVTIKVYSNTDSNCCFTSGVYTITNTTPVVGGILELGGYINEI